MDTIQHNINNLASLWTVVGKAFQSYHQNGNVHYCLVDGSEWPNRMWYKGPIIETDVPIIKQISKENNALSLCHLDTKDEEQLLPERIGFQSKSVQFGMNLPLKQPFEVSKSLQFHNVNNEESARLWSNAFQQSFRYTISPQTIVRTLQEIPYSLVYHNNDLVGTVILYQTGQVAGIHSLGVIPEMRRKGYAREIMHYVLSQAIKNGAELTVLQASKMAKPLYEKMGFSLDFMMRNYRLKTQ